MVGQFVSENDATNKNVSRCWKQQCWMALWSKSGGNMSCLDFLCWLLGLLSTLPSSPYSKIDWILNCFQRNSSVFSFRFDGVHWRHLVFLRSKRPPPITALPWQSLLKDVGHAERATNVHDKVFWNMGINEQWIIIDATLSHLRQQVIDRCTRTIAFACFCTRGDRFVLLRALLASIATSKARFGHLHFADEPSHLRIFLCSRVEKANQLHIFMNWLYCEASSLKLYLSWPISTHVSQPLIFLPQIQRFLRCRRPWRLMGLFVTTSLLFAKKQNLQKTSKNSSQTSQSFSSKKMVFDMTFTLFKKKNTHQLLPFQIGWIYYPCS